MIILIGATVIADEAESGATIHSRFLPTWTKYRDCNSKDRLLHFASVVNTATKTVEWRHDDVTFMSSDDSYIDGVESVFQLCDALREYRGPVIEGISWMFKKSIFNQAINSRAAYCEYAKVIASSIRHLSVFDMISDYFDTLYPTAEDRFGMTLAKLAKMQGRYAEIKDMDFMEAYIYLHGGGLQ